MKGRSPQLIQKRNEFLVKRYYFWHDLQRRRMDDVLEILSHQEVFLDKEYIMYLIRKNHSLIKEIKQKKPTERQLVKFQFEASETPQFVQVAMFC